MVWFNWLLVGLFSVSGLITIIDIGKPRKATTPGTAALVALLDCLLVAGVIYFAK